MIRQDKKVLGKGFREELLGVIYKYFRVFGTCSQVIRKKQVEIVFFKRNLGCNIWDMFIFKSDFVIYRNLNLIGWFVFLCVKFVNFQRYCFFVLGYFIYLGF